MRIYQLCEENIIQLGFLWHSQGSSFPVRVLIQPYLNTNLDYVYFIDYRKVFDYALHSKLEEILARTGEDQ